MSAAESWDWPTDQIHKRVLRVVPDWGGTYSFFVQIGERCHREFHFADAVKAERAGWLWLEAHDLGGK